MKQLFLLTGFLFASPLPALAQVVVNSAALQQLAGIEPPPPLVMEAPVAAPVVHHWKHPAHAAVATLKPAGALPKPVQAAARVVAPAAVTAAKQVPKPVVPAGPVALKFAPGDDELPANAAAALKPFCTEPGHISVSARAPAVAADPSAAMRLSLSRALAVQAALTACGVPPQNILPRALGAVPGQNEDEAVIGSGVQ